MQIEWTKTWTHIWWRLKSSKFMPAGACAVQCCVHSWIITNAYVAAHTDTRSLPLTTKQVQKGQPHIHITLSMYVCCVLCLCVCVRCNLAKCRRSRTDKSLFAFSRYFAYAYVCVWVSVCACILRWFYLYTNWYTLISDAPHMPPPVGIAQQ